MFREKSTSSSQPSRERRPLPPSIHHLWTLPRHTVNVRKSKGLQCTGQLHFRPFTSVVAAPSCKSPQMEIVRNLGDFSVRDPPNIRMGVSPRVRVNSSLPNGLRPPYFQGDGRSHHRGWFLRISLPSPPVDLAALSLATKPPEELKVV